MTINYNLVEGEGRPASVVALFPDKNEPIKSADENHPHWAAIVRGLQDGDESVYDLFDIWGGIKAKFKKLSDRISYDGANIRFDGDVIHDALAEQMQRFIEAGTDDWQPLAKFWEKVAQNPSEHSRENLYRWLKAESFTVTGEGDIVGYKGVRAVSPKRVHGDDEATNTGFTHSPQFESIHAGPAIVDGVAVDGHVPNNPGSVVEMPRSKVTANPSIGCHVGLHVGTWSYAHDFGSGTVLEVHVNPRDVVSVPTECGSHKMRTSKYTVVGLIGEKYDDAVLYAEEDYDDLPEYELHESDDYDEVGYEPVRY